MIDSITNFAGSLMDNAATFLGQEIDQRESLSERTSATRLNPSVLVERPVSMLDATVQKSIMQTIMSLSTARYMQAVTLLSPSEEAVKDMTVEQILEPFSDKGGNVLTKAKDYLGIEDFQGAKLTDYGNEDRKSQNRNSVGSAETQNMKNALPSLAVGKEVTVTLQKGGRDLQIPVTVMPQPRLMNSEQLLDILTAFGKDNSILGRYTQWSTGQIKSTLDYAFALDLARADRKLLLNDSDGLYKEYRDRQSGSTITNFLIKRKPLNVASNIFIVTKQFSLSMESSIRGKFSQERTRKKFFKNTGGAMLVIVDTSKEVVTFYERGLENGGRYTFDDLETNASSPNGVDLNAVMKAYQMGQGY